jgi:probable blue pigment (indigoidine) exporter
MQRFLTPSVSGLLFAMLWASASVAGKFGLYSVEPLVLFNIRFLGAGTLLLIYVYAISGHRMLVMREWKQLAIFGAFNTTLYLGLFVLALQQVTPGITSLAVALNPLFISVMSALWTKRKVRWNEWVSIVLGIGGVMLAARPLLQTSYATFEGLMLLAFSMISYSLGSVYYSSVEWKLSRTAINAWQAFIGGLLLLPFTLLMHEKENHFDLRFWLSLTWLILPVSIVAIQLWLRLLKADAVRASLWLYFCPVFGFFYAAVFVDEPITINTIAGTFLVMLALYIGQSMSHGETQNDKVFGKKRSPSN